MTDKLFLPGHNRQLLVQIFLRGDRGKVGMLDDLAAGEFLVLQRTVWSPWGVTVSATRERLDEIAAAFELALGSHRPSKQSEQ